MNSLIAMQIPVILSCFTAGATGSLSVGFSCYTYYFFLGQVINNNKKKHLLKTLTGMRVYFKVSDYLVVEILCQLAIMNDGTRYVYAACVCLMFVCSF